MKTKIIFLLIILLQTVYSFADNSDLALADNYYNQNNYMRAKSAYYKVILHGTISPMVMYRYAYSCENTDGLNSATISYYASALYLFTKNGDVDNKYYTSAETKVSNNNKNMISIDSKKNDEIIELIKQEDAKKDKSIVNDFLIFLVEYIKSINLLLIIIPAILIYIIAQVISANTKCIIIWGWWDLISFIIPGIIVYIFISNHYQSGSLLLDKYKILDIAFLCTLSITLLLSVIANRFNVFFILISFSTKLIEILIIPIVVILFILAAGSGKSDKRFKDGTKGNERTMWLEIAGLIGFFLVANLIKVDRENK